jgi:hypothetical protein
MKDWVLWYEWGVLILPWFLLFFFNKYTIKRFMPVTLLSIVLVTLAYQLGDNMGWYFAHPKIVMFTNISAKSFGLFAVGTLIIFHFTYGKFWLYCIVNLCLDNFQLWVVNNQTEKIGITSDGSLNNFQNLGIMTLIAILLYLYQIWQDEIMNKEIS